MTRRRQSLIFIGSTGESLPVARTIEDLLYRDAKIQLWTSDTFRLGTYPLESLLAELERCDYAAFVLTPDDINISRDKEQPVPRDNVIFEAGLFMGRLGRRRTFLVYDSEHEPKLPSDLKGLTLAPYSHQRFLENQKAALGPAVNQIRSALADRMQLEELDVIKAYIRFIHPDTSLADSYSEILAKRMEDIRREVSKLELKGDWYTLVEVKKRLREYFEYSGRYLEGVEFGQRFYRALQELGEEYEAAWARVKQIGYLFILAGRHSDGRKEISNVLESLSTKEPTDVSTHVLRFYGNRYLGISLQRDPLAMNLDRAKDYFDDAQRCIDAIPDEALERKEIQARLLGNYGNLAFDKGELGRALQLYKKSHELFVELNDPEHIGIANLQIAKTIIARAGTPSEARRYLGAAETIFIRLGWIEGQGNVYEQYAYLYERLAETASDEAAKDRYVRLGRENARRATALFERIDNQKRLGGVESLIDRLNLLAQIARGGPKGAA